MITDCVVVITFVELVVVTTDAVVIIGNKVGVTGVTGVNGVGVGVTVLTFVGDVIRFVVEVVIVGIFMVGFPP